MRFNHLLLLAILLSFFSACESEDQVQKAKLTTDALANQMIEEQAFADYFEAFAIHDKELQIGIVAGGSFPSSTQVEEMAQNTTLVATIYRLNEFVNASAAATAYVNMTTAFEGVSQRFAELSTTYTEEEIRLALETGVSKSSLHVSADDLIQIISEEYGIGQGRASSCIYQFSDNWNRCEAGSIILDGASYDEAENLEFLLYVGGDYGYPGNCKRVAQQIYKRCSG